MSDTLPVKSMFREYAVEFVDNAAAAVAGRFDSALTFVVCDARVRDLWSADLSPLLAEGRVEYIEPSEDAKTIDTAQRLLETMVRAGVRRNHTVVAIGGGITQDVTAFAASLLYRGISWVFVPTTLLAQADSCIGSKTSINLGDKKNLVGNFWPPLVAYIDLRFLRTLSDADIRSGIGEMLHFYLYADSALTRPLVAEHAALLADRGRLGRYIHESLRIKAAVVQRDEFDQDERHLFNYGHTFGHALESLTGYAIPHGQAVTLGMDVANYVSFRLGLMPKAVFDDLHELLAVNFPARQWRPDDLGVYCGYLGRDKKNLGTSIGCILANRPGALMTRQVAMDAAFRAMLSDYFEGPWWRT
jgi:3-dehydroquinate synthase